MDMAGYSLQGHSTKRHSTCSRMLPLKLLLCMAVLLRIIVALPVWLQGYRYELWCLARASAARYGLVSLNLCYNTSSQPFVTSFKEHASLQKDCAGCHQRIHVEPPFKLLFLSCVWVAFDKYYCSTKDRRHTLCHPLG